MEVTGEEGKGKEKDGRRRTEAVDQDRMNQLKSRRAEVLTERALTCPARARRRRASQG